MAQKDYYNQKLQFYCFYKNYNFVKKKKVFQIAQITQNI